MTNSWIPPLVNSKDGVDFTMLFTLRESLRTSDSVLLRVRSKELRLHPQTPWLWSPQAFATLGVILIPILTDALEFHSRGVFLRSQPTKRPELIVLKAYSCWVVLAVDYNGGGTPHCIIGKRWTDYIPWLRCSLIHSNGVVFNIYRGFKPCQLCSAISNAALSRV